MVKNATLQSTPELLTIPAQLFTIYDVKRPASSKEDFTENEASSSESRKV
jgi:hypothetical protein